MPGIDADVADPSAGFSPQVGAVVPDDVMNACITMDCTEANDSIASASSAIASETRFGRLRIIGSAL